MIAVDDRGAKMRKGAEFMRGSQRHTIDSKNRMFVPAKYRDELGTEIVITKSLTSKCIRVYSLENWKVFEEKISSLPEMASYDVISWLYANSEDMEIDSQGRIALPAQYIKYAGITKNVVSAGVKNYMEIWDEEAFDNKMENTNVDELKNFLIAHGL